MRITDLLLSPHGRISRLGFWGAWLAVVFIALLTAFTLMTVADYAIQQGAYPLPDAEGDVFGRFAWIGLVLAIPLTWMVFCVLVKRWHDRGRSGWWLLAALVPVIGQLWTLIECGFMAGTSSGNKYGASPLRLSSGRDLLFTDDIPEDMA